MKHQCTCRLCTSAEKLFRAMMDKFDEPGEAIHVLTICTVHCIQASDTTNAMQLNMIDSIHEVLMGAVDRSARLH